MIELFQKWMQQESVTPVTQIQKRGLQNKSIEINDVTSVTPATYEDAADGEVTLESRNAEENAEQSISVGNKGNKGNNTDSKTTFPVTHHDGGRVTRVTNELEADMKRRETADIRIAISEIEAKLQVTDRVTPANPFFNPHLQEYLVAERGEVLFTHQCESGTVVDVYRAVDGFHGLICVPGWHSKPSPGDFCEWAQKVVPKVKAFLQD